MHIWGSSPTGVFAVGEDGVIRHYWRGTNWPIPPTITTGSANSITTNSAKLSGCLVSLGTVSTANVSFDWGLVADNYTMATPLVSTDVTGLVSFALSSLSPNTTYRAKAVGDGTAYGAGKTFTTAPAR